MEGGSSSSFGVPTHRQASHVKRSFSRMEAGHRSSQSPLFVRQDSSSVDRETPPLQHNHNPPPHPRIPPFQARYAGDGLDFRRPIRDMNTHPHHASVIDLTDDDESMPSAYATPQPDPATQAQQPPAPPPRSHRLPRFGREIIDLSQDTSPAEPSSPEVQFLSERPRSPTSRIQERRLTPHPTIQGPERQVLDLTVDNNNNDDDEVVHLRTEERAGINMLAPQGGGRAFGIAELAANLFRRNDNGPQNRNPAGAGWGFGQFLQWTGVQDNVWGDEDDDGDFAVLHFEPRRVARPVRGGGPFPGQMDYVTIGFGTGLEESTPRPPTPKYSPPPDPGPGFTRSPQEEDVLVCPNCKEELGIGNTDQKKQVWVVKACGHVYCGECMTNRKAKGRKGKAKVTDPVLPPPFSSCQAPGCTKPVHKNHVMQIFL